jgi:acetolactate synthase-1/2/3 large subunit
MTTATARGCWQAAVGMLARAGVRSVFGLPGDDLDALAAAETAGLHFILCRDQRNATFMATGYALQSGALGVVLTGKGPAVTNTVTGLLEARSSAAPVLLIAGGTSAERLGSGAFQELDQMSVVRPLVKWAARVEHPSRLVPLLHRAMLIARGGVPGPVYLELPDHLLTEEIPLPATVPATGVAHPVAITVDPEDPVLALVRSAARPVVLVGGGMRHANGGRRIERFAEAFGAAVACTASGRGAVDETLPMFCGLAGLYTPQAARALWAETDCVLSLGSRLEETATFGWPEQLRTTVPIVQVNVDPSEFSTEYAGPLVLADAGTLLDAWLARAPAPDPASPAGRPQWAARVAAVHQKLRTTHREMLQRLRDDPGLHIVEVLDALTAVLPGDQILVQENGLQDMWSYQFPHYACDASAGSVVPSEQTSLGFGAAAAVGVKHGAPQRTVVAFVGDGAFGLFDADLPTAVAEGGVLYVVLRNGGYGWLQTQLEQRDKPVPGYAFVDPTQAGATAPAVPGLHQVSVTSKAELASAVAEAWKACHAGRTVVLNVAVRMQDAMFGGATANGDFPKPPDPPSHEGSR